MEEENFQRVFFHELGHFVANEIVFRNFGFRKTERMFLTYFPDVQDYEGGCKPYKPEGVVEGVVINHAEYLLSLLYGCLFETYKRSLEVFNECFDPRGHGDKDCLSFACRRPEVIPQGKETEDLWRILDAHVETVSGNGALDSLCELRGKDFIGACHSSEIEFDLEKLRSAVYPRIAVIEKLFLIVLADVKAIVERNRK